MSGYFPSSCTDPSDLDARRGIICPACYQRAENIRREFSEIELRFLIDATDARGPGRMGNHDLHLALMRKLQDALALGRRCTRCTNRVSGDSRLCATCAMKETK